MRHANRTEALNEAPQSFPQKTFHRRDAEYAEKGARQRVLPGAIQPTGAFSMELESARFLERSNSG